MSPTHSSAYDEELFCDECGATLGYGHGDFNCTYILCQTCMDARKAAEMREPGAEV
jgi:hypothetical protein